MNQRGFTLVEMLVVFMLIGISAAILAPNLVYTVQRKKQLVTLDQMNNIRVAIADYWNNQCPTSRAVPTAGPGNTLPAFSTMLGIPKDGWNRAFVYTGSGTTYTLTSRGSDGLADITTPANCWQSDITIDSTGNFSKYPNGTQKDCP